MHDEQTYNLLVVIPVYNHESKIEAIVETLTLQKIPCLLMDDGSHDSCRLTLEKVAKRFSQTVTLIRHDTNRGKGAVVYDGILYAKQQHYSHILQVDADGQHNLDDIPAFIQLSQANPEAVISGLRRYEEMPKGRRYGRLITDIWVHINTLSKNIKDSMCGYRLYPVSATALLIEKGNIGRRMDFDTDILVRLYWQGLSVEHIDTNIIYHDNIESHFDLLADNVRISKMHARLFFGMLLRIPTLLSRKWHSKPAKQAEN